MAFGLIINMVVAYQRMVNELFADMNRDTMDVYANDMLVKSKVSVDHKRDLERDFTQIMLHNV